MVFHFYRVGGVAVAVHEFALGGVWPRASARPAMRTHAADQTARQF